MASHTRFYRCCCIWLMLVALCACGQQEVNDSPSAPNQRPVATLTAEGVDLPGRLLFARAGDLWMWQSAQGRQITRSGDLAQPTWSPDGARIAAVRRGPSFSDIVLVSAGGSEQQTLTNGDSSAPPNSFERARSTLWSLYPAFTADGQSLLYVSQAGPVTGEPASDYNLTLFQSPAVIGGERTQLYASDEGHVGRIAAAPDGEIVFALQPIVGGVPRIVRYTDSTIGEISGLPAESYDPSFSADGAWLAYAARVEDQTDVFALPSGGGTPTRLTSLSAARAPAFSPDGAWLAFLALTPGTSSFDLWVAPLTLGENGLEAGEPRAITTNAQLDPDSGLSWGL